MENNPKQKRIAVLSGKGGAGKTLLSVNLAAVTKSTYVDCDVEEPNGYLYFASEDTKEESVYVTVPEPIEERCTACRICADACRFNALALVNKKLMVFEEICHSCGLCTYLCPEKALVEKKRPIGKVTAGNTNEIKVFGGALNPGEPSGIPIIKQLLNNLPDDLMVFLDCPPGSGCNVMDSIRDAHYCVLVAEPTPFGIHNLGMIVELVEKFQKPYGAVINKSEGEENLAVNFCREKNIRILGNIPFDLQLGYLHSEAKVAVWEDSRYRAVFARIAEKIIEEIRHDKASDT